MDLNENRRYAYPRLVRASFATLVPPPRCHLPKLHMLTGDMMGRIMGKILRENRKNENACMEKDYENRPVKFVMERKNVWRVVWAD